MNNFRSFRIRAAIYSLLIFLVYAIVFCSLVDINAKIGEKTISPVGVDFAEFYVACQMLISGNSEKVYNEHDHHSEIEKLFGYETSIYIPWVYPPTFFFYVLPFSIFKFSLALKLWVFTTIGLAFFAIWKILPKHKCLAFLFLGFTGVIVTMRWGQNSFLTTALLAIGVCSMESNPLLAGISLSILTYKPQLALFPLLFLIFLKKWKVIGWSIAFTFLSFILSGITFGFGLWADFINSILNSSVLQKSWTDTSAVAPNFYAALKLLNLSNSTAYFLTAVTFVISTIGILHVWNQPNRPALRCSAIILGLLLSAPYFLQYELIILSIPIVFLAYDFIEHGWHSLELFILGLLWLSPVLTWYITSKTEIQICPLIILTAFVTTIQRAKNAGNNQTEYS